jgi:hypothetical protein
VNENEQQHEDLTIRTGIQAGDDGSQMGSGHAAGSGMMGGGGATSPGGGGLGSGG